MHDILACSRCGSSQCRPQETHWMTKDVSFNQEKLTSLEKADATNNQVQYLTVNRQRESEWESEREIEGENERDK